MVYQNQVPKIYALERDDGTPERQYSYQKFPIVEENDSLKDYLSFLSDTNEGYLNEAEKDRIGILTVEGLRELVTIPFADNNTVVIDERKDMNAGEIDKYTVVIWLEGEDPQCVDKIKGGELELSMNFEKAADKEE